MLAKADTLNLMKKAQASGKGQRRVGVTPFAAISILLHVALIYTAALLWRDNSTKVGVKTPSVLIGVALVSTPHEAGVQSAKGDKGAEKPYKTSKTLKRASHNESTIEGKAHSAQPAVKPAEPYGSKGEVVGTLGTEGSNEDPKEMPQDVAYPNYRLNPKPHYPQVAKRRGYEGTVLLKVLVSRTGRAAVVEVASSSGYGVLDEAALLAVKQWLFVPARVGGEPTDSWVVVPITFRLNGG